MRLLPQIRNHPLLAHPMPSHQGVAGGSSPFDRLFHPEAGAGRPGRSGSHRLPLAIAGILLAGVALSALLPQQTTEQAIRAQIEQQAAAGEPTARLELALAYRDGRFGLPVDAAAEAYWLRQGARAGSARAAALAGDAYAEGNGVIKDMKAALRWWRRGAEQGDAHAQAQLGTYLASTKADSNMSEESVQFRRDTGRHWLERAALQGETQARQELGVEETTAAAGSGWDRVLPHLSALGRLLSPQGNDTGELHHRALAGDSTAQYQLAMRYRDGAWGVEADPAQALAWLKRAADQSNALALNTLADAYEQGAPGLAPDAGQAAALRARAAHARML